MSTEFKHITDTFQSRRTFLKASVALGTLTTLGAGLSIASKAKAAAGTHRYTLTVEEENGRQSYDGKSLGPTMRVKAGDTLDVELINTLPPLHDDCTDNPNQRHGLNTTNLHTHGLHVSPYLDSSGTIDADNIFVSVVPDGQIVACEEVCGVDVKSHFRHGRNAFRFELPDNHAPGTFWYHAHKHGSTAPQVSDGLAGALIVEDPEGFMPSYIEEAVEKVLFITDDTVLLVNDDGSADPVEDLIMRPGEVQRWRVINGTGDGTEFVFVRPNIGNLEMHLIAFDGLTLPKRVKVDYEHEDEPWLNPSALSSGNRADFIVRAPQAAEDGAGLFSTLLQAVVGPDILRYVNIDVNVEGSPVDAAWTNDETLPGPGHLPFDDTPLPKRDIAFTRRQTVDGEPFNGEIKQSMKLNTAEEWTVGNNTQQLHVYHIHVNPFLVTKINGQTLAEGDPLRRWQDTIGVPLNGSIGLKTRFETFTGKFVIHCHVLPHEDGGMMQIVEVVD